MLNKLPVPLQRQLIKMMLTTVTIGVVGFTWCLKMHDQMTVFLTCALLVAYGLRIVVMMKEMIGEEYEVVEGTVLSVIDIPLHRQQSVVLMGVEQRRLRLSGRHHFVVGERYRLYLQKRSIDQIDSPIKIPHTLLAYELV